MGTTTTPLQQIDLGSAYQDRYDLLEKTYWEASIIETKDELHGVMEELSDIIDQLSQEELEQNTALFVASVQDRKHE